MFGGSNASDYKIVMAKHHAGSSAVLSSGPAVQLRPHNFVVTCTASQKIFTLGDFQKMVFCSTKIFKIWLWTPIQRRYFDFKKMYLRVKIQFFSLFEYNKIFDEVVCALLCLKIQFSKGGFKALLHFWHSSLYSL